MGDRYLAEYMSRLGWGSGFNLPIANNENRELEKELEAKQRKVVSIRAKLEDEQRRGEDLKNHVNRTTVLIDNIGKMAQTQRGTLEHARRLNAGAENTLKNLVRDLKVKRSSLTQERNRHGKVRADLEKRQRTVDQLSAEIEWDQTAVAALRNSTKEEETDIEMMAKYFNLDENAIKDGELEYRKMKKKEENLKAQLEVRLSEVKNSELTLSRVCCQFGEVHKSRNDAVELWKGVIESLKMRDADLQLLGQEYVNLKKNLQEMTEYVKENESLLKTNEYNTREVERYLHTLHKSIADLRQSMSSHQTNIKNYSSQLTLTRLEIEASSGDLKKVEKRKSSSEAEIETILDRENQLKTELDGVRAQHQKFKYGSSSTDEKFRQLGSILDLEEEQFEAREKEREGLRLNLAQITNQILELNKHLEAIRLKMKGKGNQIRHTKNVIYAQGLQIEKRQRKFHEFEVKISLLEDKIGNQFPNRYESYDNPDKMVKKVDQLRHQVQEGLRDKVKQENMKGFTDSILQRIKKEIQQFTEQGQALDIGNDNLSILVTAYKREGLVVVKLLHQTKFEFQMMLLTRKRLMSTVQKRKQKYFSTNKNILELEAATGERRTEIRTHMNLLEQRKRNLSESKSRLVLNLSDVQTFLKNLKSKYEFVMTTMATGIESGGVSEAFLIIKFAQERETLKHEGEIWDNRVKEAEREVEGLQNTLALLRTSNQNFKTSLTPHWRKSSTSNKTTTLTEKLFRDFMILKQRTERRLQGLLATCQEKELELQHLQSEIETMRETLTDRRQELTMVLGEIDSQKAKIDRATLLTRRLLKQMEEFDPEERDIIESEIKLRCLREKFEFAIKTMTKTVETFPVLLPWILEYFKAHKLFAKLALKLLEKQESVDRIPGNVLPAIGSRKTIIRPLSRHMSVTRQVKVLKEREAQRIGSSSSSSSSTSGKPPKSATPTPSRP